MRENLPALILPQFSHAAAILASSASSLLQLMGFNNSTKVGEKECAKIFLGVYARH